MGRFSWLEMDGKGPAAESAARPSRRDMDEQTCLATAEGCLRQGQYENALQWYSRALRFAIDLEGAWLGQVLCLLFMEESLEANIWADRALERFQDSPDLLAAKAMALGRSRSIAAAMPYSDAALEVKGRAVGPFPWIVRGDLLLCGDNSRPAAERCFNKALELAGGDWYVHYLIGYCQLSKGLADQALLRFSAGLELDRANTLLLCALGECHKHLGEVDEALRAYRRAREADPLCKYARQQITELEQVGFLGRFWRWLRGRG